MSTPLLKRLLLVSRLIAFALIPLTVLGQLTVTFPRPHTVLQRNNANQTIMTILGTCPNPAERVEWRVLARNAGQGINTDWAVLDAAPTQGQYRGQVNVNGGWYRLEIRSWSGGVAATEVVQPVGVGEVFAVAGQSNGQGIFGYGAVNPADERVVCSSERNITDTTRLPIPFVGAPMSTTGYVAPRGESAWCWGRLGDRLAARFNVPVAFYNTCWSGTAVRNWRESITVDSTATSYNEFFRPGMPYGNLKRVAQDYVPLTGLRAVLWHQGEAEFYDINPAAPNYASDLETVIRQSRQDMGYQIPWMVARASMDNNLYYNYNLRQYAPVINAQNQVIQNGVQVYAGPNTDVVQMPREDVVHFTNDGIRQLGDAWFEAMNDDFFRNTTPVLPTNIQATDLSLSLSADATAPNLNAPVRIYVTVRNEGAVAANNVLVRSLLPGPLLFMDGEVSHKRGLISAIIPNLPAGTTATRSFLVRPSQEGTYRFAAEVARMNELDVDSRTNTSIGDGQDDLALISLRTRSAGNQVFATPLSVNAPSLPLVASNQPVADADKADLSLQLALSSQVISPGQPITVSIVVSNRGGRPSGGVQVGCQLPAGLAFLDGAGMRLEAGVVRGNLGDVTAGGSATLQFRVAAQQSLSDRLKAQIELAAVADPDSTPNNGYDNGEDDTAQAVLRTY
ncbi:sialate O-acetylesterase [Spirosoma pomorum]